MERKVILIFITFFVIFLLFGVLESGFDDNVIYIPNFLPNKDYQKLLSLSTDKRKFIFEDFRYVKPIKDRSILNIFYSSKIINSVRQVLNNENIIKSDFPIEHRIYPKGSPGMEWHSDLLMYQKPQYEAIYTIRNTSNSLTEWIDERGKKHSKWTEPNSILIVKANGYRHHVLPVETGEREIMKLIYTQTKEINNNYTEELERFN